MLLPRSQGRLDDVNWWAGVSLQHERQEELWNPCVAKINARMDQSSGSTRHLNDFNVQVAPEEGQGDQQGSAGNPSSNPE